MPFPVYQEVDQAGNDTNSLIYNTTAPTLSNGQEVKPQADVNGNQKNTLATLIAGEDLTYNVLKVEERFSYSNVTATTTVKSGAGFIHNLTVNNPSQLTSATTATTTVLSDSTALIRTSIGNSSLSISGCWASEVASNYR